jgi:large conductance mechanosensitive channel
MFTSLKIKKLVARNEPTGFAAGIVIGLAVFYLIQAVVDGLIAPLIAVFIGEPHFELNSFTINTSEFRYGAVIEAAITVALALTVIAVVLTARQRRYDSGQATVADVRACPECTSEIPVAAKRCPFCTAAVH